MKYYKYVIKPNLRSWCERAMLWVVRHSPRYVIYWYTIQAGVIATTGKYSDQVVPDLKLMDALERIRK